MKLVASASRHVLERPLWKEATMTTPADVRATSRAVYSVEKVFSESPTDVFFFLWHVADHLPVHMMLDRERESTRESDRVRE